MGWSFFQRKAFFSVKDHAVQISLWWNIPLYINNLWKTFRNNWNLTSFIRFVPFYRRKVIKDGVSVVEMDNA